MKIPTVILFYKNWHFLLQMLSRMDERCEITIIHNLSKETEQFIDVLNQWVKNGLIHKHIIFSENIANNAVKVVFRDALVDFGDAEYFILTDGDLLPDRGWLDEHMSILNKHDNVFVVGSDLYMDNLPQYGQGWVPVAIDRGDYLDGKFGTHLMTFRTDDFNMMVDFLLKNNQSFCDTNYHLYAERWKQKSVKTKQAKSVHLTWDLYRDINHPYTKERLNNKNIWLTNKEVKYEVYQ